MRAFLRGTVGCDYGEMAHLTMEEKARCAERFANIEKRAPEFSAIPGEKLGGFMAEAAANARKQRYREGNGPQPVVACQGVGSNFGVGCLPEEAYDAQGNLRPEFQGVRPGQWSPRAGRKRRAGPLNRDLPRT